MKKSITLDLDALKSHAKKCVNPGMGLESSSGITPLSLAESFGSLDALFGPENSEFVSAMHAAIAVLESIHQSNLEIVEDDTDI